jgi:hypothetical protein
MPQYWLARQPELNVSPLDFIVPSKYLFSHQAHRSIAYLMPPIDAIENP